MEVTTSYAHSDLLARAERNNRRALIRTFALSIAIVVTAAGLLLFTLLAVQDANKELQNTKLEFKQTVEQLTSAKSELDAANGKVAELNKMVVIAKAQLQHTGGEFQKTTAQLALSKSDLAVANGKVAELKGNVTSLMEQLVSTKQELAEALALDKFTYLLNWEVLKPMFARHPGAASVLEKIFTNKDRVHWGMSNTPDGGFNSPGFASMVLRELGKDLEILPRDTDPPQPGDVVVYERGYHLFFFLDDVERPFVVGMTPFGVTALKYDFGVKRIDVIHAGFPDH